MSCLCTERESECTNQQKCFVGVYGWYPKTKVNKKQMELLLENKAELLEGFIRQQSGCFRGAHVGGEEEAMQIPSYLLVSHWRLRGDHNHSVENERNRIPLKVLQRKIKD